jgi:hypothetical protein
MAIHTYQLIGSFKPGQEIVPGNRHIKTIHKLGIQGDEGTQLKLNNTIFEIGKAKTLYYDDADINSIKVANRTAQFLIIDFTYSDYDKE